VSRATLTRSASEGGVRRVATVAAIAVFVGGLTACDSRQESTPSTQPAGGKPGPVAESTDRTPGTSVAPPAGAPPGSGAGGTATEGAAGPGASEVGKQSGTGIAAGGTANQGTASAAPANAPAGTTGAATAPAGTTQSSATSAADRDFLASAASSGMLEIAASKLAGERASSTAVKTFAEHMQRDHTTHGQALQNLAAGEGVTLPDAMIARHQAQLDKLAALKGADFDREYAQSIGLAAHREAVQAFERAAGTADDPEVKAFADKSLPTLREHLKQAETLAQAVIGPQAGGKAGAKGRTQP
jgi:putative membrane protein